MSTPALSDTTTNGIRVGATAFFLPEESDADHKKFRFGYRIVIVNEGPSLLPRPATALRKRIIDGNGVIEDVKGEGVVGQQPRLEPGQGFKYTSYCPLTTAWGTMEGEYDFFETDTGEHFAVRIGRFYLASTVTAEPAAES